MKETLEKSEEEKIYFFPKQCLEKNVYMAIELISCQSGFLMKGNNTKYLGKDNRWKKSSTKFKLC